MKKELKFDFNDITIVPATLSDIDSRSEIVLDYNPLFVSPMDTVIDRDNVEKFYDAGLNICMPRKEPCPNSLENEAFISFGLEEMIQLLDSDSPLPKKVLIDIANGSMLKLYNTAKRIKEERPNTILMIGNIANPETFRKYCEIHIDYVRVGIGAGSACTTSANVAVHYPMGSLIKECYEIACSFDNPSKIIADGGFKSYKDIISALALGADYVMLGSILNKTIESCADKYIRDNESIGLKMKKLTPEISKEMFRKGKEIYVDYRGMSTKEVQKKWGKKELKTAEGISKLNKVEYTLDGWLKNFNDYLRSTMSYCGKRDLETFIGEIEYVYITNEAKNRFTK